MGLYFCSVEANEVALDCAGNYTWSMQISRNAFCFNHPGTPGKCRKPRIEFIRTGRATKTNQRPSPVGDSGFAPLIRVAHFVFPALFL